MHVALLNLEWNNNHKTDIVKEMRTTKEGEHWHTNTMRHQESERETERERETQRKV